MKIFQESLKKQLAVPTHFGANVKELVKRPKIDTTLEIGPGKTLSRFARQVDRHLNTQHIENLADYENFIKEQKDETDR